MMMHAHKTAAERLFSQIEIEHVQL